MRSARFLALLVLTLLMLGVAVAAVQAQAANVIGGFGCGILLPGGGSVFTSNTHAVQTFSQNGNLMMRCRAQLPSSMTPPSRAVRLNFSNTGVQCLIQTPSGLVPTTNWQSVHTPSGQVTLICRVNPSG